MGQVYGEQLLKLFSCVRQFISFIGVFAAVFICEESKAVEIHIDVGSYQGQWLVAQKTSYMSGNLDIDLPEGRHFIIVGSSDYFYVDVDAQGNLTIDKPEVARVSRGKIQFNTRSVEIDPGAFQSQWFVSRVTGFQSGVQTLNLVSGLNYQIYVGGGSHSTFLFSVNSDPALPAVKIINGVSGVAHESGFQLYTLSTLINPNDYSGYWSIPGVTSESLVSGWGMGEVHLVYGVDYMIIAQPGDFLFSPADECLRSGDDVPYNQSGAISFLFRCSPPDSDGDQVPDIFDNCIEFENPDQIDRDRDDIGDACDEEVVFDSDGDGVSDEMDICPQTSDQDMAIKFGCSKTQYVQLICTDYLPSQRGKKSNRAKQALWNVCSKRVLKSIEKEKHGSQ